MTDIDENTRNKILAEAHFIRAMAYFNLVRNWGPVPIKVNESVDVSDIASPREPESKVYELIVDDALIAEQGLPETIGSETGRASKRAAKMLLAQVYLTLENWPGLEEKSEDVINSVQFSLVLVEESNESYKIIASETYSRTLCLYIIRKQRLLSCLLICIEATPFPIIIPAEAFIPGCQMQRPLWGTNGMMQTCGKSLIYTRNILMKMVILQLYQLLHLYCLKSLQPIRMGIIWNIFYRVKAGCGPPGEYSIWKIV